MPAVSLNYSGLPQWDDLFQVLRRNRERDWAQKYPQYVVSTWMGHDITVSSEHYLQVPEELYRKAADLKPKPKPEKVGRDPKLQNNCKTAGERDQGESAQVLVSIESGRRDSNPQHSAWKADTLPIELRPQIHFPF